MREELEADIFVEYRSELVHTKVAAEIDPEDQKSKPV
jgi:hypothetical protein